MWSAITAGYHELRSAILLTRCLLLLARAGLVIASLGLTAPVRATEPRFSPIVDFSDPADAARISVEKASLSFVQGSRVGGTAARVDLANASSPEVLIRPTGQAWGWSEVQALAVAVDNPTADPNMGLSMSSSFFGGTSFLGLGFIFCRLF